MPENPGQAKACHRVPGRFARDPRPVYEACKDQYTRRSTTRNLRKPTRSKAELQSQISLRRSADTAGLSDKTTRYTEVGMLWTIDKETATIKDFPPLGDARCANDACASTPKHKPGRLASSTAAAATAAAVKRR